MNLLLQVTLTNILYVTLIMRHPARLVGGIPGDTLKVSFHSATPPLGTVVPYAAICISVEVDRVRSNVTNCISYTIHLIQI